LDQIGDLFELNVKLRCQNVNVKMYAQFNIHGSVHRSMNK